MRRFPTTWFILALTAFFAVTGYFIYWKSETSRIAQVAKIHRAPSLIYCSLRIRYDRPPVYDEMYTMKDIEGISTFQYSVRSYAGTKILIKAPKAPMYDVSFFFGSLEQDGVWKIVNKPPRGNTSIHYTVYVKQVADFKQGSRTITFTDPHYWAGQAGRQYRIAVTTNGSQKLLKLESTSSADPRYQKIVNDFRTFGPAKFRKEIADARASLGLKP